MKKVPGAIDCLSDVFVLGFWRVLLDFYSAVWEEWLRLSVSGFSGSNSDRKEIVETGNGLRASFSAPRSCIIRTKKAAWYKRLPVEFYSGCGASRLTIISLVVRVLSVG